jgi:C-terminal processing protease CtpA/Prc
MRPLLLGLCLAIPLVCGLSLSNPVMAESSRKLGSVGLQVVPTATGELVVLQVPTGTPAASAGVKPGDLIVQVDDFPLAGSDFAEVVAQRLWGTEGSQVVIHYLRPGETGRKSVVLRRAAADPKLTVSPAIRNGPTDKGGKK